MLVREDAAPGGNGNGGTPPTETPAAPIPETPPAPVAAETVRIGDQDVKIEDVTGWRDAAAREKEAAGRLTEMETKLKRYEHLSDLSDEDTIALGQIGKLLVGEEKLRNVFFDLLKRAREGKADEQPPGDPNDPVAKLASKLDDIEKRFQGLSGDYSNRVQAAMLEDARTTWEKTVNTWVSEFQKDYPEADMQYVMTAAALQVRSTGKAPEKGMLKALMKASHETISKRIGEAVGKHALNAQERGRRGAESARSGGAPPAPEEPELGTDAHRDAAVRFLDSQRRG